eukprot:4502615-Pleurochrysis_carterae.AAC.1
MQAHALLQAQPVGGMPSPTLRLTSVPSSSPIACLLLPALIEASKSLGVRWPGAAPCTGLNERMRALRMREWHLHAR